MNKHRFFTLLLSLLMLSTIGCSNQDEKGRQKKSPPRSDVQNFDSHDQKSSDLSKALGESAYQTLTTARRIVIIKSKPTPSGEFKHPKEFIILDAKTNKELISILSDETNYIFDMTKKCIFIPEYAFQAQGDTDLLILFSPSCKQIKFITPASTKNKILDIDPASEKLISIIKANKK